MVRDNIFLEKIKAGDLTLSFYDLTMSISSNNVKGVLSSMADQKWLEDNSVYNNVDAIRGLFLTLSTLSIGKDEIKAKDLYEFANIELLESELKYIIKSIQGGGKLVTLSEDPKNEFWDKLTIVAKRFIMISCSNSILGSASDIFEDFEAELMAVSGDLKSGMILLTVLKYINITKVKRYVDWISVLQLYTSYGEVSILNVNKTKNQIAEKIYDIEEKQTALAKSLSKEKELTKELSDKIKKEIKKNTLIETYHKETLSAIKAINIMDSAKQIESQKKAILQITNDVKCNTLERSYMSQIEGLNAQILALKLENKGLKTDKNTMKIELDDLKKNEAAITSLAVSSKVKDISGTTGGLKASMISVPVVKKTNYQYAIIRITDGIYVFIPETGTQIPVTIKDGTWVSHGQVVKLNGNSIMEYTQQYCTDEVFSYVTIGTTICHLKNSKVAVDANGNDIPVSCGFSYVSPNLFVFVKLGSVKGALKTTRFTMENYAEYFEYKKYKALLITKTVGMAYIGKVYGEITERYYTDLTLDGKSIDVEEGCAIILDKDDNVVSIHPGGVLYTASDKYDGKSIVVVESDIKFVKKDNGEIVKLCNTDRITLKENEVIAIDEFNRPLYYIDSTKNNAVRLFKKTSASTGVSDSEKLDVTGKVLIIGNISFRNSYTLTLLKSGLQAITLDGYLSFPRIEQTFKKEKPDVVVIDTTCISHDNMWQTKVMTDKYIAVKDNGSSRVLEEVLAYKSIENMKNDGEDNGH